MDRKKIIVFGATGSTGVYLIDYLKNNIDEEKFEIIAVGKRKTNYFKKFNIDYYSIDISQKEEFNILPQENIYALIILSGILPARMEKYCPEKYIDINIKGTLNIMEYYKSKGVDRVIYTISISDLHGYLPENKEFLPDMPIKYKYGTDHTIYAISKTAATEIIKTYFYDYGIKYYILRLPNIYLYSPEKDYYVDCITRKISYRYIIDKAIKGEDIELWGNPEQKRDIVYVKDFCQFVHKTLFAACDSGYFNVGADLMVTMRDQILGIIDVFCSPKKKSKIIYCPKKRSCDDAHMNIDKARKLLNYEPKYDYISYLEDYKKEMKLNRFEGI
jgi:UDP-glucose 4-epimerase